MSFLKKIIFCALFILPVSLSSYAQCPGDFGVGGGGQYCGSGPATIFVGVTGPGVTYQLKKNGVNFGSPIVSSGGRLDLLLNAGAGTYTVDAIKSGCPTKTSVNSAVVTFVAAFNPTLGWSPTFEMNFCQGSVMTLNASASSPISSYQWKQNGSNISGATSSTYTATFSSLSQLQGISVTLTSSVCPSVTLTFPQHPGMTDNPPVTPAVSISASATTICAGSPVTFTATPTHPGPYPSYAWKVNGTTVGSGATYTTSSLTNGQQVTCTLTSYALCATTNTVNSNTITMTVNPAQTMSMTVTPVNSNVCQGNPAIFSANLTNPPSSGTYVWRKNGSVVTSDVGSPVDKLYLNSVLNGDVISCTFSTSVSCFNSSVTAQTTAVIVPRTAFITGISATPFIQDLCYNENVTFTLNSGMPLQSIQWKVNGVDIPGATNTTLIVPASSDTYLKSFSAYATTNGCATNLNTTTYTNQHPFYVNPVITASVTITSNVAQPIPLGTAVTFTAVPVNGGTPTYIWKWNGETIAGQTGPTYTRTLEDGDPLQNVSVQMLPNAHCVVNMANAQTSVKIVPKDWEDRSYVRFYGMLVPGTDDWTDVSKLAVGDKMQSTLYLDGFGRSLQKVDKEVSYDAVNNVWNDLVTPYAYDNMGRMSKTFLPYVSASNIGKYKENALTTQQTFIRTKFNEGGAAPTWYEKIYEHSPLSRVTQATSPGDSWINGVSAEYKYNTSSEKVHIWSLAYTNGAIPVTSTTAVYATGTLYKTETTDEKGKKVLSYSNLDGLEICRKVQDKETGSGLTTEHAGWLCTYFVYDDLGQLKFIITPKAVEHLDNNSWSLTTDIVQGLCFVYNYDQRGRTVSKKSPGIGEIHYVYDIKDRIAFTQDALQRPANKWVAILYDYLERPVIKAFIDFVPSGSSAREELQTWVNNNSIAGTGPLNIDNSDAQNQLTVSSRTVQSEYKARNTIIFLPGFESETGANFTALIDPSMNSSEEMLIDANPIPPNANLYLLAQNYYDNYDYPNAKPFSNNFQFPASSNPHLLPTAASVKLSGMITGLKVRVMDNTDRFLITTVHYDEKGNTIQTITDNVRGGEDIQTDQYDFAGMVVGSCIKHMAGDPDEYSIINKPETDKLRRLTKLSKNFNNTFYKDIVSYAYDDFGYVKEKRLAPGYTGSGKSEMESLKYDYNIRGWLTGINKDYALSTVDADQWNNFFGLHLGFDNKNNLFTNSRLDGKLTGTIWKSQGDNAVRKYDYNYDNVNRFISALFNQKAKPSDGWSSSPFNFSTYVQYEDGNGNIKTLKKYGLIPGSTSSVLIDDLEYSYANINASSYKGNMLSRVKDLRTGAGGMGNNNGKLSDFSDGANPVNNDDYTYDVNGNLLKDLNKGVGTASTNGIIYNFLNKPEKITIDGKTVIDYIYDALGTKLTKKVTDISQPGGLTTTVDYNGPFIYEDDALAFVNHEEGRLKIITPLNTADRELNAGTAGVNFTSGDQGVFEYFLSDELGNTRMVLTEEVQKEKYIATMELTSPSNSDLAGDEERLYGQVDNNGDPTSQNELATTRENRNNAIWNETSDTRLKVKVSRLTGLDAAKKIGPNIVLKVMAGDKINALVDYFYLNNNNQSTNTPSPIAGLVASFIGGITGNKLTEIAKMNSSVIQSTISGDGILSTFLNNRFTDGPNTNAPKAYLNVVFFDEQFNFQNINQTNSSISSRSKRVSQASTQNVNLLLQQQAPKNGWAYIYVSNESDENVYFDNLAVTQEHGRIAEETHYYPFGGEIASITSRAFNKLTNNYRYQGDISEQETNTAWSEYDLRTYDPSIGRWINADPYDEFASPYVGMGNDPVNNTDPDGGTISPAVVGALVGTAVGFATPYVIELVSDAKIKNKGAWGALGALVGAGLGYGIGAATTGESMWLSTRAFYKGLFGGQGYAEAQNRDPLNRYIESAEVPRIWGPKDYSELPVRDFTRVEKSIEEVVEPEKEILQKLPVPVIEKKDPPAPPVDVKKPDPPAKKVVTYEEDFDKKYDVPFAILEKNLSSEEIGVSKSIIQEARRRAKKLGCENATYEVLKVVFETPRPFNDVASGTGPSGYYDSKGNRVDDPLKVVGEISMKPATGANSLPSQNLATQALRLGQKISANLNSGGKNISTRVINGSSGGKYTIKVKIKITCN